jgi:hypothetical protein
MAVNKETVCFVLNGGAGSTSNAGGATKAAWDAGSPSDFMSATGAPIVTDTTCTLGSDGVGSVNTRISGSSSLIFDSIVNGTVAYVSFDATAITDGYENGYYEVQRVDGESGQLDLLDCTYTASAGTCDIWIGGAFDDLNNCANADIMNAELYTRTCYVRGNVEQTATVSILSGGGTGQNHKRFIGVNDDSTWSAVSYGSYVEYDASAVSGGLESYNFNIDVENYYLWGFAGLYPGGDALANTQGQTPFRLSGSGCVANCKGVAGYHNFMVAGYVMVVSCVAIDARVNNYYLTTYGATANRCLSYFTGRSGGTGYFMSQIGAVISNCIAVKGVRGAYVSSNYGKVIDNCTFIHCISGISINNGNARVHVSNCLFFKYDTTDYAIELTAGYLSEDYNICDHSLANSGFKGTNSYYGLDLSDVLTDINNGDYSINTNSTVAQQYIIGKGTPLIYSLDNPSA